MKKEIKKIKEKINSKLQKPIFEKVKISVVQDSDAYDIRDDDGIVGFMALFHSRYNFPNDLNINSDDFNGWDEMREYIKKDLKGIHITPVSMLDHSGISFNVGSPSKLHYGFDSGYIGFVFTTKEKLKELGLKNTKKIDKIIEREVTDYGYYVNGEVYSVYMATDNFVYDWEDADENVDNFVETFYGVKTDEEIKRMLGVLKVKNVEIETKY